VPGFDAFDDLQRVLAEAGDDHAADGLGPGFVQRAAPERRAKLDGGQLREGDGHAVARGDDGLAQVVEALDEAESADDVFDAVDLDGARADVEVAAFHGGEHIGQGELVDAQGVVIDVDLILLHEAYYGGD